jgi:hypothetical protein
MWIDMAVCDKSNWRRLWHLPDLVQPESGTLAGEERLQMCPLYADLQWLIVLRMFLSCCGCMKTPDEINTDFF